VRLSVKSFSKMNPRHAASTTTPSGQMLDIGAAGNHRVIAIHALTGYTAVW
jgi:hypothetical protein